MNNFIKGILYALSYFTILPVKLKHFEANKKFYKGVVYGVPLAGAILGIITVLLYIVLPFPIIYKAIFVSILYLFLYGFIHLEAVADTIDGYFASLSNKNIYDVMHEPQIGAIGAIGTFCFLLLKILAIGYLLYMEQYLFIIIVFILSRASIFGALELQYHKKSKFIASLQDSFKTNIIIKILFLPINILSKFILNRIKKQLGFLNGDTLGFNIELIELILLNIGVLLC